MTRDANPPAAVYTTGPRSDELVEAGHHRQGHGHGSAGCAAEQEAGQHDRSGGGHKVHGDGPITRQAQDGCAGKQDEQEQHQAPGPMPDGRLEAPQEANQQDGQEGGQKRVARQRQEVAGWLGEPERGELLVVEGGDRVSGPDHGLVALDGDLDRDDTGPRRLDGRLRLLRAECQVGGNVRRRQVAGQLTLVGRKVDADGLAGRLTCLRQERPRAPHRPAPDPGPAGPRRRWRSIAAVGRPARRVTCDARREGAAAWSWASASAGDRVPASRSASTD